MRSTLVEARNQPTQARLPSCKNSRTFGPNNSNLMAGIHANGDPLVPSTMETPWMLKISGSDRAIDKVLISKVSLQRSVHPTYRDPKLKFSYFYKHIFVGFIFDSFCGPGG